VDHVRSQVDAYDPCARLGEAGGDIARPATYLEDVVPGSDSGGLDKERGAAAGDDRKRIEPRSVWVTASGS
jgi:hypothetical protein